MNTFTTEPGSARWTDAEGDEGGADMETVDGHGRLWMSTGTREYATHILTPSQMYRLGKVLVLIARELGFEPEPLDYDEDDDLDAIGREQGLQAELDEAARYEEEDGDDD